MEVVMELETSESTGRSKQSVPMKKIDEDFHVCHVEQSLPIEDVIKKLTGTYEEILDQEDRLNLIPLLNQSLLTTAGSELQNQMVRFVGMVQDQHESEFYMAAYESVHRDNKEERQLNCGLFRSSVNIPPDHEVLDNSGRSCIKERQVFTAVNVPALTQWAAAHYTIDKPRSCPEGKTAHLDLKTMSRSCLPLHDDGAHDESVVNFCKVKIYNSSEIKLNQLYTFVGLLDELVTPCNEEKENQQTEKQTDISGGLFELHVMSYVQMKHTNPLLDHKLIEPTPMSVNKDIREVIVSTLTRVLCGDKVAAELLLLHLVSSIINRAGGLIIGKLAINLCGVKPADAVIDNLVECLKSWLTKFYYLPMSIAKLNGRRFVPTKDFDKEKLISGCLQLSDSTQLLVDETKLETGQLNEIGLRNVGALRTLINAQRLEYDFRFHTLEFPTDLNVMVVSEGKSMLGCDMCVRMEPTATSEPAHNDLNAEQLTHIRQYFTQVRLSTADFKIPDDVQKVVEEDFVVMRQTNQAVTGEHLSQTLLIARLLAVSMRQNTLTLDCWKRAKILETVNERRNVSTQ